MALEKVPIQNFFGGDYYLFQIKKKSSSHKKWALPAYREHFKHVFQSKVQS